MAAKTAAKMAAAKAPAVEPATEDTTDPVVEQPTTDEAVDDSAVHTRVVDFGEGASVTVTVTDPQSAAAQVRGQCVVDDGTPHMGRAVHGKICSAHENRYLADGSPRVGVTR